MTKLTELSDEQIKIAFENMEDSQNLVNDVRELKTKVSLLTSIVTLLSEAEAYRIKKVNKK